jgi:hypothetical protein
LPTVDPPERSDLAPLPDRRFPTPAQATRPGPSVSLGVPVGTAPTRGSSFLERDPNPEDAAITRAQRLPAPGLQFRIPVAPQPVPGPVR